MTCSINRQVAENSAKKDDTNSLSLVQMTCSINRQVAENSACHSIHALHGTTFILSLNGENGERALKRPSKMIPIHSH